MRSSSDRVSIQGAVPERVLGGAAALPVAVNPSAFGRFPYTVPLYLRYLSYLWCLNSTVFLNVKNA